MMKLKILAGMLAILSILAAVQGQNLRHRQATGHTDVPGDTLTQSDWENPDGHFISGASGGEILYAAPDGRLQVLSLGDQGQILMVQDGQVVWGPVPSTDLPSDANFESLAAAIADFSDADIETLTLQTGPQVTGVSDGSLSDNAFELARSPDVLAHLQAALSGISMDRIYNGDGTSTVTASYGAGENMPGFGAGDAWIAYIDPAKGLQILPGYSIEIEGGDLIIKGDATLGDASGDTTYLKSKLYGQSPAGSNLIQVESGHSIGANDTYRVDFGSTKIHFSGASGFIASVVSDAFEVIKLLRAPGGIDLQGGSLTDSTGIMNLDDDLMIYQSIKTSTLPDTQIYMNGGEMRWICDGQNMIHLIESSSDYVSVNPYTSNVDFVVNGDSQENVLRVESSTDAVYVGSATGHGWDIAAGQLYWWKMSDNAADSTVVDAEGNQDAILFSAGNPENTDMHTIDAMVGEGLYLDGSDDYIDTQVNAASFFPASDEFAMSIIFMANDGQPSSAQHIMGTMNDPDDRFQVVLGVDGGIDFEMKINGAYHTMSTPSGTIPDGSTDWIHLAASYSEITDERKLWVNGEEVASASFTGNLGNYSKAANIYLGHHHLGSYLSGAFDDVRFLNTRLTAAEVAGLYASSKVGREITSDDYELDVTGSLYVAGDTIVEGELIQVSDPEAKTDLTAADYTTETLAVRSQKLKSATAKYKLKSHQYRKRTQRIEVPTTVTLRHPVYADVMTSTGLARQIVDYEEETTVTLVQKDVITTEPLQTPAPEILGFDASKLPEECIREINGKRFVSVMSLNALLAEQVEANRQRIEKLETVFEHKLDKQKDQFDKKTRNLESELFDAQMENYRLKNK